MKYSGYICMLNGHAFEESGSEGFFSIAKYF